MTSEVVSTPKGCSDTDCAIQPNRPGSARNGCCCTGKEIRAALSSYRTGTEQLAAVLRCRPVFTDMVESAKGRVPPADVFKSSRERKLEDALRNLQHEVQQDKITSRTLVEVRAVLENREISA